MWTSSFLKKTLSEEKKKYLNEQLFLKVGISLNNMLQTTCENTTIVSLEEML